MPFKNDGLQVAEYVYDFAVSGGAVSTIALHSLDNKAVIPVGAVIKAVSMKVVTAFTSGGSATLSWGNGASVTNFSGTAIAVASLTAGAVFNGMGNGASGLWDDTQDAPKSIWVDTAANGQMNVSIAVAAMTAGKAIFMVSYEMPSL